MQTSKNWGFDGDKQERSPFLATKKSEFIQNLQPFDKCLCF
ncbi:hypothetical protein [Nostoc parmelioides]|nr:hypothetical protein [Nostoc parmelioides]